MKSPTNRIARILTLAAVTASAASWSTASYACSASDPYLSSVCVLAWARNDLRGYAPAQGQVMSIAQNSALFALLGTTYGGNGATTFALPDLRGRAIIGAGTSREGITYNVGEVGGTAQTTLVTANIPAHVHTTPAVPLANVTAGIDLSKITSSVDMKPVTYTANTSQLALKASSAQGTVTAPQPGGSLASPLAPASRIYGTTAPDVTMGAGAIAGTVTVTSSGTPTVTLGGSAAVTLSGNLPAGTTGATGGNAAFNNMSPYLAMYYFIAIQGVFPSSN